MGSLQGALEGLETMTSTWTLRALNMRAINMALVFAFFEKAPLGVESGSRGTFRTGVAISRGSW